MMMEERMRSFQSAALWQEIPIGRMTRLDLNNPVHRDYFSSLYSDMEIKTKFPAFYALYTQTLNAHANRVGLDYSIYYDHETSPCYQDGIDIECIAYHQESRTVTVSAATSLTKRTSFIDEFLEIRTNSGGILSKSKKSTPCVTSANTVSTFPFDKDQDPGAEIEIMYTAVWADPGARTLRALAYPLRCPIDGYLATCIKSVQLAFPKKINTAAGEPIVVCYGRVPSEIEAVDKTYDLIYRGFAPSLLLDFAGNVTFEDPAENRFDKINITSFELKVNTNSGYAIYRPSYLYEGITVDRTQEIINSFTLTKDGFRFELDKDWKDTIPTVAIPARDTVKLTCRVEFQLTTGRKSVLQIASGTKGDNIVSIPTLNLLWGCLAKGSLITMSDGDQKTIETIQIGEQVKTNYHGATATVTCCWRGMESCPLICVVCRDGKMVRCTQNHPIITTEGILMAADITPAHELLDENGAPAAISSIMAEEGGEVFNLSLQLDDPASALYWEGEPIQGATLYCGGLLVGDNTLQNQGAMVQDSAGFDRVHIEESMRRQKLFDADCQ